MSMKQVKPDLWLLDIRVWERGKEYRRREEIAGGKKAAEIRAWEIRKELQERAVKESRSLKSTDIETFGQALAWYYRARKENLVSQAAFE